MFNINQCNDVFHTEPNTAFFWSGLGQNGQYIAADVAENNNGFTLEMLMNDHKDELIKAGLEYDQELDRFLFSSDNYSDWEAISSAFANHASGDVRVILGENIRSDGVWNTKEYPALVQNDNINKIIAVDPITGADKTVLYDKAASSSVNDAQNTGFSSSSGRDINLQADLGFGSDSFETGSGQTVAGGIK